MAVVTDIDDLVERVRSKRVVGTVLDPLPRKQHQEGPNCGFYALSIVMSYWRDGGRSKSSPPARKRDAPQPEGDEAPPESLREIGKRAGALEMPGSRQLSTGGVFTAAQLASVAKAQGHFDARVFSFSEPDVFTDKLCWLVDKGFAPIVAFDVKDGDPVEAEGQHSHWGVVIGHLAATGGRLLLATHGHGEYYLWRASALQRSNFGLANTVRRLKQEVKMRITLKPGVTNNVLLKSTNWHWRASDQVGPLQAKVGHSDLTGVELRENAMRPAVEVVHDLAHKLIVVTPK